MNILDRLIYKNDVNQIWSLLPQARLVGGVVRDLLIDYPIKDVDIATPEPPEQVMQILRNANLKVIPTGLSHGTVTVLIHNRSYEITTLRKDIQTDGRHAQVIWTDSWEEDAARRDFTMNALSCDQDGKIWDFYDGQQDLKAGKIRFVGNARTRIQEDVLRILRFFRFYARYGKEGFDQEAIMAIQQSTALLSSLSAERVWSELQKILIGPMADYIVQQMDIYGVLRELMPFGYNVALFQNVVTLEAPQDSILRLAILVMGESKIVAKHLRLSRKEEKLLWALQQPCDLHIQDTPKQMRQLRAQYDLEVLIGQSWIKQTHNKVHQAREWCIWRNTIKGIEQPVFPVKGKDLLKNGVQNGIEMGEALSKIKSWWLETGCYADQQECLQWFQSNKIKRII